ncbi:hypothetical protein [Sphingomonas arenae]|uniref:hypothetical protein n=1 Tax=Sphingomonas arenae TaxID=2812555 RepID=UPI0019683E12|nr:hypothetical protein [Sphingomonas arenae]
MSCKRWILLGLALPLAGCATADPQTGSVDRHFGEAVAWNKEAQIIDPDPVYGENDAKPGSHGEKAAAATKRYRTDAVKAVEQVGTTSGGGGNGGSGGSGGGGSGPQ